MIFISWILYIMFVYNLNIYNAYQIFYNSNASMVAQWAYSEP